MNTTHLGALIKRLRDEQGLSLRQLAEGICSYSYISRIEQGERLPSMRILNEIGNRLDTPLAFLLHPDETVLSFHHLLDAVEHAYAQNDAPVMASHLGNIATIWDDVKEHITTQDETLVLAYGLILEVFHGGDPTSTTPRLQHLLDDRHTHLDIRCRLFLRNTIGYHTLLTDPVLGEQQLLNWSPILAKREDDLPEDLVLRHKVFLLTARMLQGGEQDLDERFRDLFHSINAESRPAFLMYLHHLYSQYLARMHRITEGQRHFNAATVLAHLLPSGPSLSDDPYIALYRRFATHKEHLYPRLDWTQQLP